MGDEVCAGPFLTVLCEGFGWVPDVGQGDNGSLPDPSLDLASPSASERVPDGRPSPTQNVLPSRDPGRVYLSMKNSQSFSRSTPSPVGFPG